MLSTFLRHVDRRRIEPVVAFLEAGPFQEEIAGLGIRTFVIPSGRLRNPVQTLTTVVRLARLLRAEDPTVVVGWLSSAHLYAGPAAALARMPERCTWSQLDLPTGRLTTREGAIDRLATVLPATEVTACSEAVAAAQRRLWPYRRTVAVLPGIEVPKPAGAERLEGLREELAIPRERAVVGIVGRLVPWKGQDRFLQALAILRDEGVNAHALVVEGNDQTRDGAYAERLRDLVRTLSLDDRVAFTGSVGSAAPYIPLMDVLVNASAHEPFGLVLVEGMAAGVPVVAVDSAGPREIVVSGETGLLVRGPEPDHLASGVGTLLKDAAARKALAKRARDRFEAGFTAERMARELESRLERLAEAGRE